jgi:hypothetical protein
MVWHRGLLRETALRWFVDVLNLWEVAIPNYRRNFVAGG